MKRLLTRTLWAVAGLFVLYMLLVRALAGWVQLMPEQASGLVQQVFDTDIRFESLDIQQTWTGIEVRAQNLAVNTVDWQLKSSEFAVDFHLLSPFWPSLPYGELLKIQRAEFVFSNVRSHSVEFNPDNFLALASKLWRRIEISDLLIKGSTPLIQAVNIDSFNASRAERWSVLADVSVIHLRDHPPTSFQLSARLDEDQFGLLSEGELVLKQKQAFDLAVLRDILPQASLMLDRMPQGSFNLNSQATFNKRQLRQLSFDMTLDQLQWATDVSLPRSISAQLDWHGRLDAQGIDRQMALTLSNLRLNHQAVKTLSPIRLTLDGQVIGLALNQASLLPFQTTLNHFLGDFTQSLQRIDVQDIALQFDLQQLKLLELNATLEALDWQGDKFQVLASKIRVSKKSDFVKIQFDEPINAQTSLTQQQYYLLDMGPEWLFSWSDEHQAWSLGKHQAWLNDISIELSASGDLNALLNAQLDLKVATIEQVKTQLLPYELMSPKLKSWLQTALVSGDQIEASVNFSGAWQGFANNDFALKAEAEIHNTVLKFNPDWPALESFSAKLDFTPFDLRIETASAQLFGAQAQNVVAQINDLNQPDVVLELSGRVMTEAQNGLNFLLASPLAETLGLEYALEHVLTAQGEWPVELEKIVIPLNTFDDGYKVTGHIDFNKGRLGVFNQLELYELDGRLHFSERELWADGLVAKTANGSINANLKSYADKSVVGLNVEGQERLRGDYGFTGALPWNMQLSIPFASAENIPLQLNISAQTDGLASEWPYPLATDDLKATALNADIHYQDKNLVVKGGLAKILAVDASLQTQRDGVLALDYAHILLGDRQGKAWQEGRGVQFQGHLNTLDLDRLIQQSSVVRSVMPDVDDSPSLPQDFFWRTAVLNVDQFIFLQHVYPSMALSWMSEVPGRINLVAEADYLKAVVGYDASSGIEVSVNKLQLVLPKTDWTQMDTDFKQCLAPIGQQLWPQIRFSGTNIAIDQRHFNNLDFELTDTAQLRKVSNLKFKFANQAGQGQGEYRWDKANNQSYADLVLTSRRVDGLAQFAGFKKGFSGDKGRLGLNVSWPGGFECFRLDQLAGSASLRFDDGVIEQIEPGFARVLGLLSVDSVLRRLRLDLKDVTEKGLDYELIEANGVFKDAKLNLTQFSMKSPGVSVDIKGNLLLVEKTFDLKAKVTPALGAALPAVAGLLGLANPVTGVFVYVLAKNLPFINEDIVTYDYQITGPWADPTVKSKGGSALFK